MNAISIALVAASVLSVTASHAGARATDLDYLKANRCKGLAVGLASTDVSGFDAFLKAEGRTRSQLLQDRAEEEFARAKREATHADDKTRLSAELNGACSAYRGEGKAMASG